MNNICLECRKKKSKKELNKYGQICERCADKIEDYNREVILSPKRKSKGRCIGVIEDGGLGGLKLKKND